MATKWVDGLLFPQISLVWVQGDPLYLGTTMHWLTSRNIYMPRVGNEQVFTAVGRFLVKKLGYNLVNGVNMHIW